MEEILFKTKNIEISSNGKNLFLVVTNHRIANRINNALGHYYPLPIKEAEEPIFKITAEECDKLAKSCFKGSTARVLEEVLLKFSKRPVSSNVFDLTKQTMEGCEDVRRNC